MVYYFTSEHDGVKYTLYMGRDKIENEDLIKFGWPQDVWFHVSNLSSAHVYLRMKEGMTLKDIPPAVLVDCAQLVKANSIIGNKKETGKVRVVYTMWANLHKTRGMADGSVDFHNDRACLYTEVLARDNAIVNRLEKTRVEYPTKFIREAREGYDAEMRAREKEAKKAHAAQTQADKERHAKEKEARSYDSLFKPELMTSNAEHAASATSLEDDFITPIVHGISGLTHTAASALHPPAQLQPPLAPPAPDPDPVKTEPVSASAAGFFSNRILMDDDDEDDEAMLAAVQQAEGRFGQPAQTHIYAHNHGTHAALAPVSAPVVAQQPISYPPTSAHDAITHSAQEHPVAPVVHLAHGAVGHVYAHDGAESEDSGSDSESEDAVGAENETDEHAAANDQIARLELEQEIFKLTQVAGIRTGAVALSDSWQPAAPATSSFRPAPADGAEGEPDDDVEPAHVNEGDYESQAVDQPQEGEDIGGDEGIEESEERKEGNMQQHEPEEQEVADTSWTVVQPPAMPEPMQLDTPPTPVGKAAAGSSSLGAGAALPPRHTSPRLVYPSQTPSVSPLPRAAAAAASHGASVRPAAPWSCGDPSLPATSLARYVPSFLAAAYASEMYINSLYPWQAECLTSGDGQALHEHGNLVYSAPTSGGKTLVAELLLFRYQLSFNLFRSRGPLSRMQVQGRTQPSGGGALLPVAFRSLFIVPFNALVQEKARDMHRIVRAMYRNIQQEERAAASARSTSKRGHGVPSSSPSVNLPDDDAPQLHVKAIEHVSELSRDSDIVLGVVTIEKAAMLLNMLIAERRMEELGLVVFDECHMLGDASRGFLLEHVLTKLLYIHHHRRAPEPSRAKVEGALMEDRIEGQKEPSAAQTLPPLQIIGLSATLPNIQTLCECLHATFFQTDFRPVPLHERYAQLEDLPIPAAAPGAPPPERRVGISLHDREGKKVGFQFVPKVFPRLTNPQQEQGQGQGQGSRSAARVLDPSLLSGLCFQLWASHRNGIVFCSSKKRCADYARTIARSFHDLRSRGLMEERPEDADLLTKRRQLMDTLRHSHFGLDPVLAMTLPYGVAFHHAGLSFAERDAIEDAYRQGTLFVLCATTTLACGINIGAARVIFTSLQTGPLDMGPATYKQCSGRAGRAGKNESGESIILRSADSYNFGKPAPPHVHAQKCKTLMNAPMPPLESCLDRMDSAELCRAPSDPPGELSYAPYMSRLLLDAICAELTPSHADVMFLLSLTLLKHQRGGSGAVEALGERTLQWLQTHDFIRLVPNLLQRRSSRPPYDVPAQVWRGTPLGQACTVSALSPKDAIVIHQHLSAARDLLIMEGGLHALFLITPLHVSISVDWDTFFQLLVNLSQLNQRVAARVGVDAARVDAWRHMPPSESTKQSLLYRTHVRFFHTLVLHEYLQWEDMEIPQRTAVGLDNGVLQGLSDSARSYGHLMSSFCMKLQWLELALVLKQCVNERFDSDMPPGGGSGGPASSGMEQPSSALTVPTRPLAELTRLRIGVASALYQHGLTSLEKIDEASLEDVSRILRQYRGHVIARDGDDSMEHQASMLKRQAARLLHEQRRSKEQEKERLAAARQRRIACLAAQRDGPARPPGSSAAMPYAAHTPSPATPQSQYHASHLLDQLKSPGATASPAGAVGAAGATAAAVSAACSTPLPPPRFGGAAPTPSLINVSSFSHSEWQSWRTTWSTRKTMFWHSYGIRRTRQEQRARERVLQEMGGKGQASAVVGGEPDGDAAGDDDDGNLEIELSQAEQEDLLLSPAVRTFFHASHFHLYPLTLRNIAGIALTFDEEQTVYDLRIGDKYNDTNQEGVTGKEMWEAFCFALLDSSLAKVCINAKVHLQILNSLPMPLKVVQHAYQRFKEYNSATNHSTVAPAAAGEGVDGNEQPLALQPGPSSTSFLTLLYLMSKSHPLQLLDVRIAHWLLYPGQKELLSLDAYYAFYHSRVGALEKRTMADAIPCSPDARTTKGFDLKQVLARQQLSLKQSNPYAPEDVPLPALEQSSWNQVTFDRFRFARDAGEAAGVVSKLPLLHARLLQHLLSSNLLKVYLRVESPISSVLAHMEFFGMGFSSSILRAHVARIKLRLRYLLHHARLYVQEEVDFDSPKCFVDSFVKLAVPLPDWFERQRAERAAAKSKGLRGCYRDIPRLLEELALLHPYPRILLELRKLRLSLSHFDTLPSKSLWNRHLRMERIHPTLLQNTHTGRLSCQDPNLQCVSKEMTYNTAPLYSLHEELSLGRLDVVSGTSNNGVAQFRVHHSPAEKRVRHERLVARKREIQRIESSKRQSPQMKAKLPELRKPPKDMQLYVMALHPNGTLDYGLLYDVRTQSIGHGILVPDDPAVSSSARDAPGLAPSSSRYSASPDGAVSLAEFWELASNSRCRWDVAGRCNVRVAVVLLHRPPMFAFFPADQVWRSEAYVPWEVDQEARREAGKAQAAADVVMETGPEPDGATASTVSIPATTGGAISTATPAIPVIPSLQPSSVSVTHTFSVRDSFVAADGYVLLSVDYSNIELRLMAHFSQDATLMQLFNERVDVITAMAERMFKVPYTDVSAKQRATAKSCVYALLYGAGVGKVAEDNGMSVPEAQHFLNEFHRIFPTIRTALRALEEQVAKDGHVKTLFDRRRTLDLVHGSSHQRAAARRKAPNTLCQGSAADLVKAAMQRVLLHLHRQECQTLYQETARLIMQMHDELVFEALVVAHMESENKTHSQQFHLRVPLVVRTKVGSSWGTMHSWKIGDPLPT